MAKIRRQPRRSTKRRIEKNIANPFFQNHIPSFVPIKIAESLVAIETISFQQLDEFVQSYSLLKGQIDKIDHNVRNMKEAVLDQQLKIEELRMITKHQKTNQQTVQDSYVKYQCQEKKPKRIISKTKFLSKVQRATCKSQKKRPSITIYPIMSENLVLNSINKSIQQLQKFESSNPEDNEIVQNLYDKQQENAEYYNSYSFDDAKDVWGDHNEIDIPVNIEHQESQEQLLRMPPRFQEQNQEYHIK